MQKNSIHSAGSTFQEKKKVVIDMFRRFIPIMLRVIPGTTVFLVLLKIIPSFVPIVQIYLVKELIDTITKIFNQQQGLLPDAFQLLAIQAAIMLFERVCFYIETLVGLQAQQKLKYHFEQLLIHKSARLPLSFYDRADYYDQLEKAAFGVDIKGFNIFNLILNAARTIITMVGLVVVILSFHWILAVAVLLMLVPNILVNTYFGRQKYNQMVSQTPTQRKAHYLLTTLHSRAAAKELRVYNYVSYLFSKWKTLFWQTSNERYELEKRSGSKMLLVHLSHNLLNTAAIIILIFFGASGALTIGHYVSLTQAIGQIQFMITSLGSNIASIYEESLFVSEVLNYLDLEDESTDERTQKFPDQLTTMIEVDNLYFTYASHSAPQLKGISFTIKPGEKIAIVGENGAGKSTLVKCLLGLYMPDSGTIRFDGIDIDSIDPTSMRKNVSAVFQDYVSYQLTARENIAMGHDRMHEDAFVQSAAAKSGIGGLLERLPNGLDTELGPAFSNGYELSGGQWQKIALSRAFIRDAQIVILDEPTAALDPRAEAEIYDKFANLYEGKTTIMISHRLSSCRFADKIIVLNNGEIVEEGSHDDLVRLNGTYAEMFHTQAKRYTA
ncbi:ABC transporter ATP-binding protein [Paenibacillus lentus]|uniref:ABC transporter ATP-binding protein n=1 Tax=Paenibacillus lentus TaxID=1338368 RepID=UPI00365087EC